jgi:hypothetical protein
MSNQEGHRTSDELELEVELASLRSHEKHMRHIYSLRWGGLILAAITIGIGAVMVFRGLEGSFNWAIEVPNSIGAKLTNASPGVVFATVGMILGFIVILQKPVNYTIGDDGMSIWNDPHRRRRRSIGIRSWVEPIKRSKSPP